jgi:hypothetical protein
MKTFINCAVQGDLMLIRVESVPKGYEKALAGDGKHIVAHSETGHHHCVEAGEDVQYYTNAKDMMKAYLVVQKAIGSALEHLRDFDTHETILIPPGIYELRRQREYTPAGFRRVED